MQRNRIKFKLIIQSIALHMCVLNFKATVYQLKLNTFQLLIQPQLALINSTEKSFVFDIALMNQFLLQIFN